MNRQKQFLPVLAILFIGLVVVGCSDNPTQEEVPVELTAWFDEATIELGGSVAVSYELSGDVAPQWVMAQFVEPDGTVGLAGFPEGTTTRDIPLPQAGEYSIFVRVLTEEGVEMNTTPSMVFTVLEE